MLLGIQSMYTLFIVYVLFQPLDEARTLFKFFDSNLGKPLPERSYAEDCRVYTPENPQNKFFNVYESAVDCHFFAHLFGWWLKMMIIRDVKMCWLLSIMFELLEVTFRHWLPNFWECWWDHVSLLTLINVIALFGCLGVQHDRYHDWKLDLQLPVCEEA
jgi:phosphatidylserine synthase 2